MKKYIILVITLFWVTATLVASELYYYAGGERINLYMSEEKVSVIWTESLQSDDIENTLSGISILKRDDFSYNRHKFSVLKTDTTGWRRSEQNSTNLRSHSGVKFAYPLLYTEKNDTLIFANELIVKLKPPLAPEDLGKMYNVNVIETDPYDKQCVVLEVQDGSELNALEIANKLVEGNKVKWASPNFIRKIVLFGTPDDTYYSNQWALEKMEVPAAWDLVTGNSDVTVAVIDEGVDLDHPDLQDIIVTGYDAIDGDNTPQCSPGAAHGTACAGIIGAITNNGEGIAGVAGGWGSSGGCRIMPIRISSPGWAEDYQIKYCFEWATDNGADILSNSWGQADYSDPVHDGIEYAVNHDVLVFCAAGNERMWLGVMYPARDPLCIAVGATDHDDERWWYSHYGPELDITAPSGNVPVCYEGTGCYCTGDIWTTDNTGEYGYWPLYEECEGSTGSPDGDYFGSFGGTSAACPYAAGVAALIRSFHPGWSHEQVRDAIETRADDIHITGWDQYTGWGRVNALRSLVPDDVVAVTEGRIETSPVLMDVNGNNKQEIFIGCADGNGDYKGKVYAYDCEWNLVWEKEVEGSVISNPCISDLNNDGNYELVVATTGGNNFYLYVLNAIDGSNFGTWPKSDVMCVYSSPACGDVDGDGYKEVVIGESFGTSTSIKTFEYDGSSFVVDYEGLKFEAGITLVDVDGDEVLDICGVARGYEDPCVVLEPGSGASRSDNPDNSIRNFATMAAVGEVGNINYNEWADMVSVSTGMGVAEHENRIHCWQYRNLDGNWVMDELWSHLFNDGPVTQTIRSSPIITDVDNDGYNEVIAMGDHPAGPGRITIKCFEHDGNLKWQQDPTPIVSYVYSSPSLGDIDDDGKLEVLVGIYDRLYSFNAEDGTSTGFPIKHVSGQIKSSPLISDIDHDGKMEIIVTTLDNFVYSWEAEGCETGEVEWGMFHKDSRNSGVYYPKDLVLRNITVEIDESIVYQVPNTITAAGEGSYFTIEGNGSNGGNVTMQTGNYISLLPGFEAQEGCVFNAYNENPILSDDSITGPLAFDFEPDSKEETSSDSSNFDSDSAQTSTEISSEEIKDPIPTVFSCAQNFPNPFMRNTTIKYGLPKNCDNVKLTIFNLAGQAVKTLVNGQQSAGFKSVRWDGTNSAGVQVPQGIYFYVFKADDFEDHRKMVLLK